ncbi:MAG: ABC-2 family transporter protein [Treponema sp.]|nr:ABC-2 family transporter protein [Treponema sp.]
MIYFRFLAMNVKAVLEYRLSAWLIAAGQTFTTIFSFLGIALLFNRFGNLGGWTFAETALCFTVTGAAFVLSECFARGFDAFSGMVIRGEFDRVLLRPRNTIIQVLGAKTDITRLGRLIVNLAILFYVLPLTGIIWTPSKITTLVFMIIGGAAVFTGIFILGATVCFFTLEGLEVINIFTDGGRELASYPLPVYGKWVTRFFTFIIPLGCMNYLPLMYLTGRAVNHPLLYMLTPLIGFVFIIPCVLVWEYGIRHYTSSGS